MSFSFIFYSATDNNSHSKWTVACLGHKSTISIESSWWRFHFNFNWKSKMPLKIYKMNMHSIILNCARLSVLMSKYHMTILKYVQSRPFNLNQIKIIIFNSHGVYEWSWSNWVARETSFLYICTIPEAFSGR